MLNRNDLLLCLKRQLDLLQRRQLCSFDTADRLRRHGPDIADKIIRQVAAGNDLYGIAQEGDGRVPLVLVVPMSRHRIKPAGFGPVKMIQHAQTPNVPYLMLGTRDGMSRWRETLASARADDHGKRVMTLLELYAYRQAYSLLPGQLRNTPSRLFAAAATSAKLDDDTSLVPTLKDDSGHIYWVPSANLDSPSYAPSYPWCVERHPLPE